MENFAIENFNKGRMNFEINIQPVSLQNKSEKKKNFKSEIQKLTSK